MASTGYFRIRLTTIRPDKITNFDVFLYVDGKYILYLRAGDKLSDGKIERLHARDTGDSFFVRDEDKQTYRDWVREEMNSSLIDPFAKAAILRESSVALMEDLFENPDVNTALDESRPIIKDFIDLMEHAPEAMGFMISLSGHDFYTYNHSLDVSIYSLGLGKALGYDAKTEDVIHYINLIDTVK
mgnify:CR=1 FL=1